MTIQYPVLEALPDLRQALSQKSLAILQAPPGSGKSTVLPLHLLDEPWLQGKKIILLEPRRLAAKSVAARLATLHGDALGNTIGYRIRFESNVSSNTRIEVVTDGILTRMLQETNALDDIGMVIFDEFHERSLQADTGLVLCHQVQQYWRDDLRILIMSATLETEKLARVFGGAPVITSSGRQYPVAHRYEQTEPDQPIPVRTARAIRKAYAEQSGDMLVFLPGAGEIERTRELVELEIHGLLVVPLYGDLPFDKQQQAILPDTAGRRKVVLATTIAETSLTIEGITTVIDVGYTRIPVYDPRSGLTGLETVRVTLDAADQRAGRAGRLGPGVCYRLWTPATQRNLQPSRPPEIVNADMTPVVLELRQWGIRQVIADLAWPTPPAQGAVRQAEELLTALDAIDEQGITARGKEMMRLPTHPRIAHMLLEAQTPVLQSLAADVAAVLEEKDLLREENSADLSLRVEVLHKWRKGERVTAPRNLLERVERLSLQWRRLMKVSPQDTPVSPEHVGLLLAAAYPERIARQLEKQDERYKLANGRVGRLPNHDPLIHYPWICIAQLDARETESRIFLAAPISENDVADRATLTDVLRWDKTRQAVVALREKRLGSLVVTAQSMAVSANEDTARTICTEVAGAGLSWLEWGERQQQWQARVMSLRAWNPDQDWPDVSTEALLSHVQDWLSPFLAGITRKSELSRLDWSAIFGHLLGWERTQLLDQLAPEKISVPSGSMIALRYDAGGATPVIEVRLQEVFGWLETPAVNAGKTRLVVHLLSPGYKPVQVTQDMKSFWQNTYDEVRSELKRRYPKHSWPENPWTAQAVRGAIKRR